MTPSEPREPIGSTKRHRRRDKPREARKVAATPQEKSDTLGASDGSSDWYKTDESIAGERVDRYGWMKADIRS